MILTRLNVTNYYDLNIGNDYYFFFFTQYTFFLYNLELVFVN